MCDYEWRVIVEKYYSVCELCVCERGGVEYEVCKPSGALHTRDTRNTVLSPLLFVLVCHCSVLSQSVLLSIVKALPFL